MPYGAYHFNTELARIAIGYTNEQEMETLGVILKHLVRRERIDEVDQSFWRPMDFSIRAMDVAILSRFITAYGPAVLGWVDETIDIR